MPPDKYSPEIDAAETASSPDIKSLRDEAMKRRDSALAQIEQHKAAIHNLVAHANKAQGEVDAYDRVSSLRTGEDASHSSNFSVQS
jgi:hypothetical protein